MHTYNLDVKVNGQKVWMIINGDFSGEAFLRWYKEEGNERDYEEIVLPDGFVRAIIRAGLVSALPEIMETIMDKMTEELWKRMKL